MQLSMAAYTCSLAPGGIDDYRSALALARRAVALQPSSSHALFSLGFVLLRDGQFKEAAEQLQKATVSNGDVQGAHVYGHYPLAVAYFRQDRLDDARQQLSRARSVRQPGRYEASWRFPLVLKLLEREATQLIEPTAN